MGASGKAVPEACIFCRASLTYFNGKCRRCTKWAPRRKTPKCDGKSGGSLKEAGWNKADFNNLNLNLTLVTVVVNPLKVTQSPESLTCIEDVAGIVKVAS